MFTTKSILGFAFWWYWSLDFNVRRRKALRQRRRGGTMPPTSRSRRKCKWLRRGGGGTAAMLTWWCTSSRSPAVFNGDMSLASKRVVGRRRDVRHQLGSATPRSPPLAALRHRRYVPRRLDFSHDLNFRLSIKNCPEVCANLPLS